jgi:hypothetical protein
MTRRFIGDTWYAEEFGIDTVRGVAGRRPRLARLIENDALRGAVLWWLGRRYDGVVLTLSGRTAQTLLALDRFFGWRRGRYLVLLEFIPVVGDRDLAEWGDAEAAAVPVRHGFWRWIGAPALRRHLLSAHSMTRFEIQRNAAHYGLDPERLIFVPLFAGLDEPPPPAERGSGVFASGRAACDWETVFAAAEGQDWDLTVVCGAADLDRVRALDREGRATILSEISKADHARLMAESAVYLLALREAAVSSGQIRLTDAAVAGTPVAAAGVRGLLDYLSDGENALVYPPGDAEAARAAVNRLLGDPDLGDSLVEEARARGRRWTRTDYLRAMRELLDYPG